MLLVSADGNRRRPRPGRSNASSSAPDGQGYERKDLLFYGSNGAVVVSSGHG